RQGSARSYPGRVKSRAGASRQKARSGAIEMDDQTNLEEQARLRQAAAREGRATALAHPNIAFIKYWGNQDDDLRLPANPSLSMNLAGLFTVTSVTFDPDLPGDQLTINNAPAAGPALERVTAL